MSPPAEARAPSSLMTRSRETGDAGSRNTSRPAPASTAARATRQPSAEARLESGACGARLERPRSVSVGQLGPDVGGFLQSGQGTVKMP